MIHNVFPAIIAGAISSAIASPTDRIKVPAILLILLY